MSQERAALGGMLEQFADFGVIEICSEPLDAIVKRRFKTIWTTRICPNCDADALHALDGSARIWCGRCGWKTTYTRGTPFYGSELAPGEFLVAFILYADTLLSINQIAPLLDHTYKTVFDAIKNVEAAFARGFPPSGTVSITESLDRHRLMRPSKFARDSRAKIHRGTDCPAAGRPRADERGGRENRATR